MKNITYQKEEAFFSPNAFFSNNTVGREFSIESDPIRTEFQRDRDRIIHSKAFRRLMHKMQVFLSPAGDHYRTRLTHTLEVSQIARTLAVALRLNEDLTEAAALGHDIGHTPFGHSGERALDELCEGGFRHNEQSLRVVQKLENLNLTAEVLDGIYCHRLENKAKTLEGQLVRIADKIAYINHDIDDALRAGLIKSADIPKKLTEVLGSTHSMRISAMVNAVIACGAEDEIRMETKIYEATMALRDFMFERVYRHPEAVSEDGRIYEMISLMFRYFKNHTDKIPAEYRKNMETDGIDRAAADYIASMTDRYALAVFDEIFVPKIWNKN